MQSRIIIQYKFEISTHTDCNALYKTVGGCDGHTVLPRALPPYCQA